MGSNPHANGGLLLKNLRTPPQREDYLIDFGMGKRGDLNIDGYLMS